jgi:hypothetical protein
MVTGHNNREFVHNIYLLHFPNLLQLTSNSVTDFICYPPHQTPTLKQHAMKAYGVVEVKLHFFFFFFTSTLGRRIVGCRACLDLMVKRKTPAT